MQPSFVLPAVEQILKKYTCPHCGERTDRVDPELQDAEPINCRKCSAEIGYTAGEFRTDTHKLGKAQIDHIQKSQALDQKQVRYPTPTGKKR